MPRIPISPKDLPTEADRFGDFDTTLTYRGTVDMIGETRKDKNDHDFISIRVRVTEPESYDGRIVYDNYVSLPWEAPSGADAKTARLAKQSGDRLGDLARSAGIEGDEGGWDTDDLLEKEITFTVSVEPYNGKLRPRIDSYLLPKDQVPF